MSAAEKPAAPALNLTPLRRRVLAALEQRGEMRGQDIGWDFPTPSKGRQHPFKTPQQATRWSAAFMSPLVAAGYVLSWGCGLGGHYRITAKGKEALRHAD